MDRTLGLSVIITIVFICSKLFDRYIITPRELDVKAIIKDAIYVYISSVIGLYGIEYIPGYVARGPDKLNVFTDLPNF
jgi:hypothetical protein